MAGEPGSYIFVPVSAVFFTITPTPPPPTPAPEFLSFLCPSMSRRSPLLLIFLKQQSRAQWDCACFWALTFLDCPLISGQRPACCWGNMPFFPSLHFLTLLDNNSLRSGSYLVKIGQWLQPYQGLEEEEGQSEVMTTWHSQNQAKGQSRALAGTGVEWGRLEGRWTELWIGRQADGMIFYQNASDCRSKYRT